MIDGKNVFDETVKNDLRKYENNQKITTDQGDNSTTGSLLHHPYFKNYCRKIAKDLPKQQALDGDLKAN